MKTFFNLIQAKIYMVFKFLNLKRAPIKAADEITSGWHWCSRRKCVNLSSKISEFPTNVCLFI